MSVDLIQYRRYQKAKVTIESLTVGAGFACPNTSTHTLFGLLSGGQTPPLRCGKRHLPAWPGGYEDEVLNLPLQDIFILNLQ